MRGIRKCREHHRAVFLVHFKKHSSAFSVCNFRPSHFFFCTAFLWYHISCHVILYQVLVDTKLCSLLTVCVSLRFPKSVPAYMVIIRIEFENNAKFRHISKLLHRVIRKGGTYSSITENFIGKSAGSSRSGWKEIGIRYFYGIFFFFYFRCI